MSPCETDKTWKREEWETFNTFHLKKAKERENEKVTFVSVSEASTVNFFTAVINSVPQQARAFGTEHHFHLV